MSSHEGHPTLGAAAVLEVPGNYQPIHLEDTVGAIFLGILSVILLIGWTRAEARYRKRLTLEMTHGNHTSEPR